MRRSNVLSLPLQLVFHANMIQSQLSLRKSSLSTIQPLPHFLIISPPTLLLYRLRYRRGTPFFAFFYLFLFCFLTVGSTLTPLTPISVSDVNKSLLSAQTISVLGDNAQFQTGEDPRT